MLRCFRYPGRILLRFAPLFILSSSFILTAQSDLFERVRLNQITKQLQSPNPKTRHDAAQWLTNLGCKAEPVMPALLRILAESKNFQREDIQSAIYLIGHIAETCGKGLSASEVISALPLLAANIDGSQPPEVREVVAFSLGRLDAALRYGDRNQSQHAISALLIATSDPDPKVQRAAVEALGRFHESGLIGDRAGEAVTAITHALTTANQRGGGADLQVQLATCGALKDFGPIAKSAAADLVIALKSSNPDVQRAAAFALAKIGEIGEAAAPAAEVLTKALADSSQEVQKAVAYALGQIKPPANAAVPALITAMDDANAGVRADAASALENYTSDESAFSIILNNFSQRSSKARLLLAGIVVHFAEKTPTPPSPKTLELLELAQEKIKSEMQTSTSNDKTTLQSSLTTLQEVTAGKRPGFLVRFRKDHKLAAWIAAVIAAYLLCFLIIKFVVLRLWPLQLMAWNEALGVSEGTLSPWLLKVQVPLKYVLLIGFFHYSQQVLDAWIEDKSREARKRFEGKQTVRVRRTYVRLPVDLQLRAEPIAELSPRDLQASCSEDHWFIRILGEGGVGKTTLACQLAFWAMADEPSARLYPKRRMLPVLLEAGLTGQAFRDSTAFKKAILAQLQELTGVEESVPEKFVQRLLRTRRILVILDGMSEIDEAARSVVWDGLSFSDPEFPVPALIVTSRTADIMDSGAQIDIRPMRIDSNHLLPFMNAYVAQAKITLADADLFEGCKRLALMVGQDRGITPLLAKLYAEALIGFCKSRRSFSELPQSVPELVLAYLNELNRTRTAGNPGDALVHAAAKRVAWECMMDTFRPGRAKRLALLSPEDDPTHITEEILLYLEARLRLIETIPPSKTHVQFVLDPLAEYLAAMYVVDVCGSREDMWKDFLQLADEKTGAPTQIEEFLIAICDCIRSTGAERVPQSTIERLSERIRPLGATAAAVTS